MKKITFHISNKLKIFIGIVALAACVVGGSYAWFTTGSETTKNFTIGSLKVSNNIQTPDETKNYEPGEEVQMQGSIANNGSIPSITRIYNVTQVQAIYADESQTPIAKDDRKFVQAPASILSYKYGPASGDYFDNEGAYWFSDAKGQVYLLLDPHSSVDVKIDAKFNDAMGNQYQGATFKLGEKTNSTQVLDGAVQDNFGIALDDLMPLDNASAGLTARKGQNTRSAKAQKALDHLHELAKK